jgi:transposase
VDLAEKSQAVCVTRLLSIGLRLLTLTEFVVRHRLAEEETTLAGLYAGNPKRTTTRPTAGRLLEAFQEITLTTIQEPDRTRRHLAPLSGLQLRILDLLSFPSTIYTRLCADSGKPP